MVQEPAVGAMGGAHRYHEQGLFRGLVFMLHYWRNLGTEMGLLVA
jgi:hypothetical protein